jgi:hypothetical protein
LLAFSERLIQLGSVGTEADHVTRYIKSTVMVVAGALWLAIALLLGLFLFQYLIGGAGLQVFDFLFGVSPGTVLIGLVHFVGFSAAACLCFVIGAGLCVHGLALAPEGKEKDGNTAQKQSTRHFVPMGGDCRP